MLLKLNLYKKIKNNTLYLFCKKYNQLMGCCNGRSNK